MKYEGFSTFKAEQSEGILTVTFDYPPVNVQGAPMLADLNTLAMRLERDRDTKVVVFQSAHPEIWVSHYDTDLLQHLSTEAVSRDEVELLDLQAVLERISKVPQATIAKLEGFARGGGHEFALACDMRFAARGKFKFMQMEVGMGILPCGGGASRMARQVGLGRALEIILSARDFTADEAEAYGTINKAPGPGRDRSLRGRLGQAHCQVPGRVHQRLQASGLRVHATNPSTKLSRRRPIGSSRPPARPRPSSASPSPRKKGMEHDMENQRNWNDLVMQVQDIH